MNEGIPYRGNRGPFKISISDGPPPPTSQALADDQVSTNWLSERRHRGRPPARDDDGPQKRSRASGAVALRGGRRSGQGREPETNLRRNPVNDTQAEISNFRVTTRGLERIEWRHAAKFGMGRPQKLVDNGVGGEEIAEKKADIFEFGIFAHAPKLATAVDWDKCYTSNFPHARLIVFVGQGMTFCAFARLK